MNPGSADTVAEQLKQVLDPQRAPVDTNIEIPPSPVTLRASLTKDSRRSYDHYSGGSYRLDKLRHCDDHADFGLGTPQGNRH